MNISPVVLDVLLQDAIARDRTTARRAALLNIIHQEHYLTREQLIVRVEGKLGKGCFGDSAWQDTFYRDIQVVKRALRAAGYHPAYSRSSLQPGYYLRNQPSIGSDLLATLDGCVAEVDRSQISIYKQLSFEQRFQQGCSITNLAHQVVAHRIQQRHPQFSLVKAHRLVLEGRAS